MQTVVKSFIAFFTTFLLALIIVPFATAYADETIAPEVNEYSTEIGPLVSATGDPQEENSYRFVNGERLSSVDGALTEPMRSKESMLVSIMALSIGRKLKLQE